RAKTVSPVPPPPEPPLVSPLPRPPPPPPQQVRPSRKTRVVTLIVFGVGFIALHIALDLLLDLSPGDYTGLPGARLLEIFVTWFPIGFLAALLGPGSGQRAPVWLRFGVLLGYAAAMISLVAPWGHGQQWAEE